jgi:hypothetical protein
VPTRTSARDNSKKIPAQPGSGHLSITYVILVVNS